MKIIVIGVSAGGPCTLKELFSKISNIPYPVLIAQHNVSEQMEGFAQWFADNIPWKVTLVKSESKLQKETIYLPSGGKDLVIKDQSTVIAINSSSGIAPSIDRLFESAARVFQDKSIGIILGGLGKDGVKGAKKVIENNGIVIVQKDAKFSYLPMTVKKSIPRVKGKKLQEIILYIENLI